MPLSPVLRTRLVRYGELRPCVNAFIDARSPGSDRKENFTIIGPGVAENPNQYVHIREAHGFNIGGARQPPHCTNSLHSHDSEEVFIVHEGTWRFFWGEHGDAGEVILEAGDTISIPIHVFRGFENVGADAGFMFAVLGGDDPGRVHWAPQVIEKARAYGLVLLENGSLVDTTLGETVSAGAAVVNPSTREEIAYIRTPTDNEMARTVARRTRLQNDEGSPLSGPGVHEALVIGAPRGGDATAPIATPHGFSLHLLTLAAGAETALHRVGRVEVLLVHRGRIAWSNDSGDLVELERGDTFSVPVGMARRMKALGAAEVFVVRGGGAGTLEVLEGGEG